MTPTDARPEARADQCHPAQSPRQRTLRRRLNNYGVYRTIRRAIRDCAAAPPILLAPCGYGWFFERFQRDGIPITGVDIDPQKVEYARAAVTPAAQVHQGNVAALPFGDGEFDFVVSNRFLLHFAADFRAQALKELARVTRRHLLVHYDTMSWRQALRALRGAREPERDVEKQAGYRQWKRRERKLLFTREMMQAEGAAVGLRVKKLYYVCRMVSDRVYCLYEKENMPAGKG